MSNPIIPPIPPIPQDEDREGAPTQEVDGERILDPDVDDALIDSAEADRVAAGADDDAKDTEV